MAKAKKKAGAKPRAAKAATPPPIQTPGRKFAVVRTVTLPVLALKIESPAYVTFRGTPRGSEADGYLLEVMELESQTVMDLAVPPKLAAALKAGYSGEDGHNPLTDHKSFCIVRHAQHDRKNAFGFTVEEIDPAQRIEAPPQS
jgi:hypothetical protein